jgi:hypothetical protein
VSVITAEKILVGTDRGLFVFTPRPVGTEHQTPRDETDLAGREVIALARDQASTWSLVGGRAVWRASEDGGWEQVARVTGPAATCLAVTPHGVLVGTDKAHVRRLEDGRLTPMPAFDAAEGRKAWYTPWGAPPAVRSISAGPDGVIYVNVHVGGVLRSADDGHTWHPTLDIEEDVHQVTAHSERPGLVLVAAFVGLGVSRDGGLTWTFETEGLHAHYARAVVIAGETILMSASTGPGGRRAALYRRPLAGGVFERCRSGLPEWFSSNIDTGCLAAAGATVVFGTDDGRLYQSNDTGIAWTEIAAGLPPVRAVTVG